MWLKGVVMRAHYNGLIPRNPFAQFHISPNVKEREYLTPIEESLLPTTLNVSDALPPSYTILVTEIPGVSMVNFMRTAVNEQRKYRGLEPLSATDFLKLLSLQDA